MITTSLRSKITRIVIAGAAVLSLGALVSACDTTSSAGAVNSNLEKGIAAVQAGQTGEAEQYLSEVITSPGATVSQKATAYFNRAEARSQAGNTSQAIADYSKAVANAPSMVNAWYNLAVAETSVNYSAALRDYDKVLALKPSNQAALYNSGILLYSHGDKAAGIARIRHAIAINPQLASQVPSYINLG